MGVCVGKLYKTLAGYCPLGALQSEKGCKLKHGAQVLDDLVLGNGAQKAIKNLAVFEFDHRWNALNLVLGSQVLVFIQVDFYELHRPRVLGGQLIDKGKQRSAMAAPGGPEKNEHRPREPDDFAVKRTLVDGYGIPGIRCGET